MECRGTEKLVCGLDLETWNIGERQRRGEEEKRKVRCHRALSVDLLLSMYFMDQGDAGQGFREVGVCGVEGGVMLVQLLRVCVPHHVPSHCRVTSRHLPVLGSAAEAPGLLSYL